MSRKATSILAWTLCGIIAVGSLYGFVTDLAGAVARGATFGQIGDLLFNLIPLAFAFPAALILSRQPQNAIGWLLMTPAAIAVPQALFAPLNLSDVTSAPATPSLYFLLGVWFESWSWLLLIFPILVIPILFPTGSPVSPRWRWVLVYAAGMIVYFMFLATFVDNMSMISEDAAWQVANPIGFIDAGSQVEPLIMPWMISLGLLTVLSFVALFLRYRNASATVREQIKWLLYACGFFAVVYLIGLPLGGEEVGGLVGAMWNVLFILSILGIPAAIAIAVLRYRLYDIDVIIRKTLIYTVLTVLLALVYFGSVVLLQRLFGALTGVEQSPLAVVASTLAIFALFAPLRRRVQGWIDRRFFRKKYDGQQVLAAFGVTARDETDLDALTGELMRVVQETMQPAHVSIWLRER